jgi:hypothetical protein
MTVRQDNNSWTGTIGKTDETNDLAVIRVNSLIGKPLWQNPSLDISPLPGDQLLLVGSPYGLEGTVTTGVVSRVAYDAIPNRCGGEPRELRWTCRRPERTSSRFRRRREHQLRNPDPTSLCDDP